MLKTLKEIVIALLSVQSMLNTIYVNMIFTGN